MKCDDVRLVVFLDFGVYRAVIEVGVPERKDTVSQLNMQDAAIKKQRNSVTVAFLLKKTGKKAVFPMSSRVPFALR